MTQFKVSFGWKANTNVYETTTFYFALESENSPRAQLFQGPYGQPGVNLPCYRYCPQSSQGFD